MKNEEPILINDETSELIIDTAERLAMQTGGEKLTVRMILRAMGGVSNRVFYNRFRNVDEVLITVYKRIALKMRESLTRNFDPNGDFFTQIIDVVATTLTMSYDIKMNLNRYVFDTDSVSNTNYEWWKTEISRLIELGKAEGHFREMDTEKMSYAIWCFIRGYNTDAISRGLPRDEAMENFRYSFRFLLEGMSAEIQTK